MSYEEFLLAYENGRLGCSVSAARTLRLVLAGRIRETRISRNLLFWLLGFLLLTAGSAVGYLEFPLIGAIFCTAVAFGIYALLFFFHFGDLVLSVALTNRNFFEFAMAERALWIHSEDEKNLPKL
jgi:hypothetical protein